MAILENEVEVNVTANIRKHYVNLGYSINKAPTKIIVNTNDLLINSTVRVTKICDNCGFKIPKITYGSILKSREKHEGIDLCLSCANSYNGNHPSIERCIVTTHPHIINLLNNPNDAYKITSGTTKKIEFKCSDCGFIDKRIVNNVVRFGFKCKKCSDGISYPEKFMMNLLEQSKIKYEIQKSFSWSDNKFYDFYLPNLNCIIETHGEQHYVRRKTYRNRSLQEEQKNDLHKEQMALKNNIGNYIVINCMDSTLEFIKNNILNSELNKLLILSQIDFLQCHEFACSNFVKTIANLWNKEKNISTIKEVVNLSNGTIRNYLKKAKQLNWCDYDPKEIMKENALRNKPKNKKKIVQLSAENEFIKVWDSISDASSHYGINNSAIIQVLKGKTYISCGFKWQYKEDYDKGIIPIDPPSTINNKHIVQLTMDGKLLNEFESLTLAGKTLGINTSCISNVCKGKREHAGGYKWLYKEQYDKGITNDFKNKRFRSVVQLSIEGQYINEYKSVAEAGRVIGKHPNTIFHACRNKEKTAGGFKWMYKEEYLKLNNI
jgi:hypothetical protein